MAKKHAAPEQIIAKLREAEVLVARGKTLAWTAKLVGAPGPDGRQTDRGAEDGEDEFLTSPRSTREATAAKMMAR